MTSWLRKGQSSPARDPDPSRRHARCVACGATNEPLLLVVLAGNDLAICNDYVSCCRRFRLGMTPAQFQLYTKGVQSVSLPR